MGTNYYFVTKSRRIAHKYFAETESWGTYNEEYQLLDVPDFHYEIHLNKLSYGWRPLFQKHKAFHTFAELEAFYLKNQKYLKIYDEYEREFTWDEYKKRILEHATYDPSPVKWVYDSDIIGGKPGMKYLHTTNCDPKEADLYTPFSHIEYTLTEKAARNKFCAYDHPLFDMDYMADPDYPIDWVSGDFS